MGFTLIAAACGGNDDGGADDGGAATAPATDASDEADTGDTEAPVDTEAADTGDETADTEAADTGDEETADTEADDSGDESGDLPVSNEGDPQQGGTLRYGLEADVDGINPTSSALSAPGLMMANAVFDNLTAPTPEGDFVPYLAESVEPNDDFSQWTVTLRPDILFHDGTPLNADAVVKNFETQRADPLVGLAVAPYYPEEGATEVIDDLTVQFNLLEGNRYFPGALSSQLGYVASPAWIDAALADPTLNQQPVGTGPFMFDSRSEDSITTFVRNDDWWGGDVYLDSIEFVPVTDPASRNDLFFGGDLNAIQGSDPESV
ncbi:ABC transporter substrate-binding protein, partial [Ilumatobacter sp.]|uniref:ABC transporter substrate-binding protein n=1 Tax=Ilumatobacter sp. TaxID=1967498 RepID=UPI003C6AF86C